MLKILNCRRSSIALICIMALTFLGYTNGAEVAAAIATIAVGIAGANAYEKKGKNGETSNTSD